jgi:hypothetical protein
MHKRVKKLNQENPQALAREPANLMRELPGLIGQTP